MTNKRIVICAPSSIGTRIDVKYSNDIVTPPKTKQGSH
jgi:hypothetical protein